MRHTKIVATVGPASSSPERLAELIRAGADVLRLNFSHAGQEQHAEMVRVIRKAAETVGREVGVLGDLPGPKIRVGDIEGDVVELEAGAQLELTSEPVMGSKSRCSVSWSGMSELTEGTLVYLADGAIRLRVLDTTPNSVLCEVEVGGSLSSHKGINLPDAEVDLPAVDEADLAWVDFAVEHGIDLLAISFVRKREDLLPVEERLEALGSDIPLIAKIEKPQAAENAKEIVEAAVSGIMVARGDLGIELPLASIPVVQKRLLSEAGHQSKPSITATQMLASMVSSPRPTRAEVTDVANAIFDGTDAVMLSEETAVGKHPVEAVRVLVRVAEETEPELPYGEWLVNRVSSEGGSVAAAVAQGAVGATYRLGLAAIVVPTRSGRTARLVSAYRPRVPVLAISPRIETVRRLNLLFGVQCVIAEDWTSLSELLNDCARLVSENRLARSGDKIAITAGLPTQELGTNLFEVHRVP